MPNLEHRRPRDGAAAPAMLPTQLNPSRSVELERGQWDTAPVAAKTVLFVMSKPFQRGHYCDLGGKPKKVTQQCRKFTDTFHEKSSVPHTPLIPTQSLSQTLSLLSKQEKLFRYHIQMEKIQILVKATKFYFQI